jgi:hypothetical protein
MNTESEVFTNELLLLVITALQSSPIKSVGFDVSQIKILLNSIVLKTMETIEKAKMSKILRFIKTSPVLNECIIPNIVQIMSDGKIDLNDTPALLSIILGVYVNVNQTLKSTRTVTITSNDLIAVVGLLLKAIFAVIIKDDQQLNAVTSLIDTSVAMIKLSVKAKNCTFSLCCKSA